MRIVNLGTFLLPVRFSLSALMAQGGSTRVTAAITAALPEYGTDAAPETSELLLDFHRSQGARQMESMLFEGSVPVAGLGRVHLYISSLSIGFVVAEFDLPDDNAVDLEDTTSRRSFKAYETPLSEAVKVLVAESSARISRAVDRRLCDTRPEAGLPAGELLWWHRIAVNPPPGREFPAAHWYGVRVDLAEGMTASIGNGFSLLYGDGGEHAVADVVEGLMVATQEWLIVDEAKRLLAEHLIRLSRSRNAGLVGVDAQYLEVLKLTEEVTLRNLVLSEEARYLANARMRIREASAVAWRMSMESAELESRAAALRDLFGLHRERITNNRDDRRNRLIVVLTVITLIQGVLVWYDFLTEDDVTVASGPRPSIALAVFVVTLATLAGAFGYRYLDAVRGWWRRRRLTVAGTARVPAPRPAAVPEQLGQ
jgi:hypothetical protein